MSDKVIRLGGSHAGNAISILNLVTYLDRHEGRTFIVCSANREILEIIGAAVVEAFRSKEGEAAEDLLHVFSKLTRSAPVPAYNSLVNQVTGILRGIRLIGDYSEALKDQVLSYSEKLTSVIFQELFSQMGTQTEIIYSEDLALRVTPEYGNATYISLDKAALASLEKGVYLVPGSYGITEKGKIARAGHTAADYIAAFLTKESGAGALELWGLEQNFYRADPAIVADSQCLERLTYSEASELAYFDHISFHPRTVEPLEAEHIPVNVVDTDSGDGMIETVINTEAFVEPQIVKSVACTDDISLLRLNGPGVGLKPGILAKVTSRLNSAGINIKSVITSQISIHLILERNSGKKALELISRQDFSAVREITLIDDVSLVGVVGHGMQQSYGVSAKIFSAVAAKKINVVLSGSGASDLVSYLIVKSSDKEKSVREIYNAFFSPGETE